MGGVGGVKKRGAVRAPTRQLARSITFPLRDLVATGQGDFYVGAKELTPEMCYLFHCLIDNTIISSSDPSEDRIRLKATI